MRALIIDDDVLVRRIVQGVLMSACKFHEVVQRNDGKAGLNEIMKNPTSYDLVVLDRTMPEMSGLSVLKMIRKSGNRVPVIMCTALDEREDIVEAIAAGVSDYMVKPFTHHTLEMKVQKALKAKPIASVQRRKRIALVVDDSKMIRAKMKEILEEADLFDEIIYAEDGDVALVKFGENQFDLVLLDWEMERKNGIDVVKEIRKTDQYTPLIMVTSRNNSEDILDAFDSGVSNFITKPFEDDVLIKKVKQVLKGHSKS